MTPSNSHLAQLFVSIGELLKAQGANPYRARAYKRAAEVISDLQEDIGEIANRGELEHLEGIGKDLSLKIREYLQSGTIQMYEELRSPLPSDILPWVTLPGFSEPVVHDLYFRLGIRTLDDLEALARSHLLRTRPGISVHTEILLGAIQGLRKEATMKEYG